MPLQVPLKLSLVCLIVNVNVIVFALLDLLVDCFIFKPLRLLDPLFCLSLVVEAVVGFVDLRDVPGPPPYNTFDHLLLVCLHGVVKPVALTMT